MSAHSPTPWKASPYELTEIVDNDDNTITACYGSETSVSEDEADAAHIVKCVNAHDDLVERYNALLAVCEEGVDVLQAYGLFDYGLGNDEDEERITAMRAAIANAEATT